MSIHADIWCGTDRQPSLIVFYIHLCAWQWWGNVLAGRQLVVALDVTRHARSMSKGRLFPQVAEGLRQFITCSCVLAFEIPADSVCVCVCVCVNEKMPQVYARIIYSTVVCMHWS